MTGMDWQGGAKLQNATSFYYFATDQWRNEEIDTAPLVSPDTTPRYRHPGDYNIMAVRLGWLPAYPCFNKSGQKIFDEEKAAGFECIDGIRKFVAQSLKNRTLEFSWEDPDAPENFPRNLFHLAKGKVEVRAWRDLEKKTVLSGLTELASDRESERFTFEMVAIQPRETITSRRLPA